MSKADRKQEKRIKKELTKLVENAQKIRNRIKGHKLVRAGDLVQNELNYRTHDDRQKAILRDLYEEVGFAKSLTVYELPDGRYKLIDGHCRQSLDPDMMVSVEILDVNEEDAHKLLAGMDPSSALAGSNPKMVRKLMRKIKTDKEHLSGLFGEMIEKSNADDAGDLELDIGGGEEDLEETDFEIPTSQVRMMQFFFNAETHPKASRWIEKLAEPLKAETPTDVVFEALKFAYKKLCKREKV